MVSFAANSPLLTHFNMENEIRAVCRFRVFASCLALSPMCKKKKGGHVALSAIADLITCQDVLNKNKG